MRSRGALATLAWIVLVVAGSTGVWAVIRTVGADVTAATVDAQRSSSAPLTPTAPRSTKRPRQAPGVDPAETPSARPSTEPSQDVGQDLGQDPGASPVERPAEQQGTRPSSPPPSTPDRQGGSGGDGAPAEVSRPWQGTAGSVVTTCRGSTLEFDAAQANAGWRIEVGDRGPREVEVHFQRDGDGGEVEVKARCSGGVPDYDVASSGSGSGDD